jgi:ribonuclease Y
MVGYLVLAVVTGVGGFLIARWLDSAKYDLFITEAKARARAIEHEAQLKLQEAEGRIREEELKLQQEFELQKSRYEQEIRERLQQIERKEEEIKSLIEAQSRERLQLQRQLEELERERELLQERQQEYQRKLEELEEILGRSAGLTREEAEQLLLQKVEENLREDIAHLTRRMLEEAKREARKRAEFVIAQATTRYAGEFAGERLINSVEIGPEEMKGRIIGKDGKNIKTLEMVTGCDIVVDETPGIITVSSFNIYRRQIAVETIRRLVADGRINPTRIEETYQKVVEEFEEQIAEKGEEVLLELGLASADIHPELKRLIGKLEYRASFGQNALKHSIEVAHLAGIIAAELGGDELLAKRAGLLHDIGKALSHEVGGDHVTIGYELCKRYQEPEEVLNAIKAHHGHEEPHSIEAAAVCTADALSAARPGARREVLEQFLKRMEQLEEIAKSFPGVVQAYGLNSGRELRVIVEARLVNDDEAVLLSHEIGKRISREVSFPGFIKVNVIRQNRAISKVSSTYKGW